MPSKGGSARDALKRSLSEIEERGKPIRIGLTVANDLALVTGFALCAFVGILGISAEVCKGPDACGVLPKDNDTEIEGVELRDGVQNLTHSVWIVAALQTLIAFYFGPILCQHPLNLICCGKHRKQVLAIYSISFVLLF